MNENYGVLRVVRVLPARSSVEASEARNASVKRATGWLPEEGLVHILTRRTTSIGRALNNDVILMDPTVSREHARLVLDSSGWHILNLSAQNTLRVNGRLVPAGRSLRVQPQDIFVLGNTMLQLIAPAMSPFAGSDPDAASYLDDETDILPRTPVAQPRPSSTSIEKGRASLASSLTPQIPLEQQQQPTTTRMPEPATSSISDRTRELDEKHARAFTPPSLSTVSAQSAAQGESELWEDDEAESILGAGITMQFALPQRMGIRTRWLIAGIGLAILLTSAMITIILNSVIGLSALAQNGAASIVAALIIPLVPAIGIFLLVNFMDRYEREPWFLRLAAFLWGAIIAIPPAFFIEQKVDPLLQNLLNQANASEVLHTALQELNVGVTEETIKGLGLLLLFVILRDEFDNITDGIVYGALIGAGFAMVENFSYFALNSKNFLVFLIVGRIILGWLGHSTFIACFGAALGYVRHTRVRWKQLLIPFLGFLVAVGLHSFFNFVDFQASAAIRSAPDNSAVVTYALIAIIGNYVPPFLAQLGLLYILIKSLAHEAAIIREFLAVEVSDGVVTVGEYALLQNSFHRTKEERSVLRKCGFRQWMRVKALYQTEIGLAFRKWHVHMGDKPKLGYIQPEDAYRRRIRRLRNEIRAGE